MELTTGIKLIKNLEVTYLNDEKAMVDFETGKYFLLKGSANDIWDYIQEETTVEEIVNKLLKVYDVDKNECLTSVIQFLEQLKENGFIDIK